MSKWLPSLIEGELESIDSKIEALQKQRSELIKKTVESCNHPKDYIYELSYRDWGWMNPSAPWLICSECGYTEEGWGCGFKHESFKNVRPEKCPKISEKEWNELSTIRIRN